MSQIGQLSVTEIVERLNEIAERPEKFESIELCIDVMVADHVASNEEMKIIRNIAEELGLDFVVALGALSFFAAASVIGRVSVGLLADYVNVRLLVASLLLVQAIGMLLFSGVQTLAQVPFYIIVFALPYGGSLTMRPVITGYFFGRSLRFRGSF